MAIHRDDFIALMKGFTEAVDEAELKDFLDESNVALYRFADDSMSSHYAGYLSVILTNDIDPHTIYLAQRDGGIKSRQVTGRRVLVVSDAVDRRYTEFIGRHFTKLEKEGAVPIENVRYLTAHPYRLRKIGEFYPVDNGVSSNPRPEKMVSPSP